MPNIVRLTAPQIRLTGKRDTNANSDGTLNYNPTKKNPRLKISTSVVERTQQEKVAVGRGPRAFLNEAILAYRGDIAIDITTVYPLKKYKDKPNTKFYGWGPGPTERVAGGIKDFGDAANIYYTLDGSDPVRSAAILYRGNFKMNTSPTGSDIVTLKARVFYEGTYSETSTARFRFITYGNTKGFLNVRVRSS
jgi:hypothetical protein